MLIKIPDILNSTQLAAVKSVMQQAHFVSGQLSAGSNARKHKSNEELSDDLDCIEALNNVVMTQLVQHPIYLNAALPIKIAQPIYARYAEGMSYGYHIDDPVMGNNPRYRSDLAITVFISDSDEYDGGELVIDTMFGQESVKLAAGHAIIYPASSRHAVTPVTRGERLVAVTWVQSMIRNTEQRQILFQLHQAREQLKNNFSSDTYQLLDDSYVNLVRMWAEV